MPATEHKPTPFRAIPHVFCSGTLGVNQHHPDRQRANEADLARAVVAGRLEARLIGVCTWVIWMPARPDLTAHYRSTTGRVTSPLVEGFVRGSGLRHAEGELARLAGG